jgi:hypothetical protein
MSQHSLGLFYLRWLMSGAWAELSWMRLGRNLSECGAV